MSSKKTSVKHEPTGKVVVSSTPSHRFSDKRVIIGIIIGALVLLCLVVLGLNVNKKPQPTKSPEQLVAAGDYNGAVKALKKQASDAPNKTSEAAAYTELASIASTAGKPTDAVTYAQQANSVAKTADSAATLGFTAIDSGNWRVAAAAFKQAVARSPKPADGNQYSDYYYYLSQQQYAESHL